MQSCNHAIMQLNINNQIEITIFQEMSIENLRKLAFHLNNKKSNRYGLFEVR
jgi:hypothetical protein